MSKIKVVLGGRDCTSLVERVTWSGNFDTVCFKLELSLAASATDKHIPQLEIKAFDGVQFFATSGDEITDGDEVFRGFVFNHKLSPYSNVRSVVCYDHGYFLAHSKASYNFKQETPEGVTATVCGDHGVEVGDLIPGSPYDRIHDADTLYDIIMTGYTILASETGEQYMTRMDKGKLNVVLKGKHIALRVQTGKHTITGLEYEEDASNVVNRVKIYDEARNEVGEVELEGDYEYSGVLQEVYQAENGNQEGAKGLLQDVRQLISGFEAFGDLECVTGNAVVVEDAYTGSSGVFYIDSHNHTWEGSKHMMSLTLAFENVMDETMAGQEKEEASGSFGAFGGDGMIPEDSASAKLWNLLQAKGFSPEAAAGIIGNAMQESGIDPEVRKGTNAVAMGIFQWGNNIDGSRWQNLLKWADQAGRDPWDMETQVDFAIHEMGAGGMFASVGGLEGFKKLDDVAQATRLFSNEFERPGTPMMENRLRFANEAFTSHTEAEKQVRAQAQSSGSAVSDGNWVFPLTSYTYMSSAYGERRSGDPYGDHGGVDYAAPAHTSILAASSGTVAYAGWADGYGNLVVIDHGGGIATAYAHIASDGIHVNVGQTVATGQLIGGVGTTGPSTGNHLHFELREGYTGGPYGGWRVDPGRILNG